MKTEQICSVFFCVKIKGWQPLSAATPLSLVLLWCEILLFPINKINMLGISNKLIKVNIDNQDLQWNSLGVNNRLVA